MRKESKIDEACWKGYKAYGMKKKGNRMVPNCKPIGSVKKEELAIEAKVDQGRSDYGKASIRNYRRKGPGHGEPAMFDPENKRGKLIDKRREEHKARRGVKGAKVPAYKVDEDYYAGTGEKVAARTKKYMDKKGVKGAPGLDAMKARTAEHKAKRGVSEENALEKRAKENEKARKFLKKDAKDSGYTDIALKASMSKGAGVSESKATAKLAAKVLKGKEPCNECGSVAHVTGQCPKKDHDIGEGVMDIVNRYKKKKEEKKPQKAQDAGARARRVLKRREYQSKVSAIVPAELEDQKVWDKIKKYI